jgi:hypothetical protein
MRVPAETARDLAVIVEVLRLPESHSTWTRPIALLIPCTSTHTFLSDASYGGLGGWSPAFKVMWQVMRDALLVYGFPMKHVDTAGEPIDVTNKGLHINPVEFTAIIINLCLALKLIDDCPRLATGYIVTLFSDDASAISWMRVAGKCTDPGVRRLARLASALLVRACSLTALFQTGHVPGKQNNEVDCVSRLVNKLCLSWDYVIKQCSQLATCRMCLLSPELLSMIAVTLLLPLIKEMCYDDLTTKLLNLELELVILSDGLRPRDLQSTILT